MASAVSEAIAAVEKDDAAALRASLSRGSSANAVDEHGLSLLHLAAAQGKLECLAALLEAGADKAATAAAVDGATPLHVAAAFHQEACAAALLDHGAELEARTTEARNTPLLTAAWKGATRCVALLLARGAAIDAQAEGGMTALLWATALPDKEAVRVLLEAGADTECREQTFNNTPLILASGGGTGANIDVVRRLLDHGAELEAANLGGMTALHAAALDGQLDIARFLITCGANTAAKDRRGALPHDLAIGNGHTAVAALLPAAGLASGGRIAADDEGVIEDDSGWPVVQAAQDGNVAELRRLLDAGGPECLCEQDILGGTPLHAAALYGQLDCMELLLERGADVAAKTGGMGRGESPLHFACAGGVAACVRLLLQRGADTEAIDEGGLTPLFFAVRENKLECARELLDRGASRNAVAKDGSTPLQCARSEAMTRLLQEYAHTM